MELIFLMKINEFKVAHNYINQPREIRFLKIFYLSRVK
jgi:hypothetical protein